ncbi:MAG: hypothetical protein AAB795_00525 [Patescibacteria group bacterium]
MKSSRGTDEKAIFEIPNNWTKKNIKSALDEWCFRSCVWDCGENLISYNWKYIKVPHRKELNKKYDLACKRRERAIEKWKILAAMFNVRKFSFL